MRGAVFVGEQVLLVRERSDGRWTLPGGWVDVNDSPAQAVEREILEESGYRARAVKLAALVDKNRHPHPPGVHHIYKLMFLCELTGGAARTGPETDAVAFYPVDGAPGAVHPPHPALADRAALSAPAAAEPADRLRLSSR